MAMYFDPSDAFTAPAPPEVGEALKACEEGDISALDQLRRCDGPLREDDWELIQQTVQEEGEQALLFVQDLITLGSPIRLDNPFGTVSIGYDARSEIDGVQRSLEGESDVDDRRVAFRRQTVPVPIFSTGFSLGRRELAASRRRGEPLDVSQFRDCAFAIMDDIEDVVIGAGSTNNWGGHTMSGLLNYHGTDADGTTVLNTQSRRLDWNTATTTDNLNQILDDLSDAEDTLIGERFRGPMVLYVNKELNKLFNRDWKDSGINVLERIRQHTLISQIRVSEKLPVGKYIVASLAPRSMQFIDGLPTQVITWTSPTGMRQFFYVFAIASFLIRQSYSGRTGYVVIQA